VGDGLQPAGRPAAPAPLDLVQDFANTLIPEWDRDDIPDPVALTAWLRPRVPFDGCVASTADVRVAHGLRAAMRALARVNTTGEPVDPIVEEAARECLAALPVQLAAGIAGVEVTPRGYGVRAGLALLAITVLEARLDGSWARLKACRTESCGWIFYDASRNRSSNWCSMTICGSRTKARRARARKREHA
jgi:predicted RNA-binding Zn ribbon-like protein